MFYSGNWLSRKWVYPKTYSFNRKDKLWSKFAGTVVENHKWWNTNNRFILACGIGVIFVTNCARQWRPWNDISKGYMKRRTKYLVFAVVYYSVMRAIWDDICLSVLVETMHYKCNKIALWLAIFNLCFRYVGPPL